MQSADWGMAPPDTGGHTTSVREVGGFVESGGGDRLGVGAVSRWRKSCWRRVTNVDALAHQSKIVCAAASRCREQAQREIIA